MPIDAQDTSVAVVVVGTPSTAPEEFAATANAVADLDDPQISSLVVVTAGNAVVDLGRPDAAMIATQQITAKDFGTLSSRWPEYVVVLRAGDMLTAGVLPQLRRELRQGVAQQLYALRGPDEYTLDTTVATLATVVLERDHRALWTGALGFVVRGDVLARCDSSAVGTYLGLEYLFFEATLRTGVFRPLAGVQTGSALEDALTTEACLFDVDWYHDVNRVFGRLIEHARQLHGRVPALLQSAYLYLLRWRWRYNRNTHDKMVLRNEVDQFWAAVAGVLQGVDAERIVAPAPRIALDHYLKAHLLQLKDPTAELGYDYFEADIRLTCGRHTISSAASVRVDIDLMHVVDGRLRIAGQYAFPMLSETTRLVVRYRDAVYEVPTSGVQSATSFFGRELSRATAFDVEIPLRAGRVGSIRFALVDDVRGADVLLDLRFRRAPAKLTNDKAAYWAASGFLFSYRTKRIAVSPTGPKARRQAERQYLRKLLLSGDPEQRRAALVRVLFFLTRRWLGRSDVWIYFDKIYKAGDNGEYAYRYARRQRDGVRKCYILRSDVPDARRFRRERVPFVRYGTLLHKLLFLHSEVVLTTHINPQNFGGFAGGFEQYFRGLFRYRLVCIQHGLSVQNLSSTLNQVFDDTQLFCLASPVERENLLRPEYGYRDDQLAMTGLARYDGLRNRDKRQLLIMPTWRNYLASPYRMGRSREYSERFRETEYFRLYNDLITDPTLLEAAEETGYRLLLMLHPVTSAQVPDFTPTDRVEIAAATGDVELADVFNDSSLMVTDYSGVQFDFAYMDKPVVYYHPQSLPPSYDEGEYRYETMALGPVTERHADLVATLCEYMRADCALEPEYRERIEKFFAHHDQGNAARIYRAARTVAAGTG